MMRYQSRDSQERSEEVSRRLNLTFIVRLLLLLAPLALIGYQVRDVDGILGALPRSWQAPKRLILRTLARYNFESPCTLFASR